MGNLGDQVSEQELVGLFSAQPGFVTLKVVRNAKSATAFVDFADLAAAMAVHDTQQVSRHANIIYSRHGDYAGAQRCHLSCAKTGARIL